MKILKINDVFTYDNNDYIALDKEIYDNHVYFFVNKLINDEEPSKDFYVFEIINDNAKIVTDTILLNKLLPIFSERFNKKLEVISNNY